MQQRDRKRFAACLAACAEIYGRAISDTVADIWWRLLATHDIEAVETAFQRWFQSPDVGQFQPKPADIVRLLTGTSLDAAMVAWSKVDRAVRRVGPYPSVTFDDALVQRVLQDMGGWIGLGTKTEDEWPFVGNEFRTRYQGYRSRGETPEYPSMLVGLSQADADRRGVLGKLDHVLIGDESKAREVAAGGTTKPMISFTQSGGNVLPLPTRAPSSTEIVAMVEESASA